VVATSPTVDATARTEASPDADASPTAAASPEVAGSPDSLPDASPAAGEPVVVTLDLGDAGEGEVTFTAVVEAGETRVQPIDETESDLPTAVNPLLTVDITTTTSSTGPIAVCLPIPAGDHDAARIRLYHFSEGAWTDITTLVGDGKVCGQVSHFSPFAVVVIPAAATPEAATPEVAGTPEVDSAAAGDGNDGIPTLGWVIIAIAAVASTAWRYMRRTRKGPAAVPPASGDDAAA